MIPSKCPWNLNWCKAKQTKAAKVKRETKSKIQVPTEAERLLLLLFLNKKGLTVIPYKSPWHLNWFRAKQTKAAKLKRETNGKIQVPTEADRHHSSSSKLRNNLLLFLLNRLGISTDTKPNKQKLPS